MRTHTWCVSESSRVMCHIYTLHQSVNYWLTYLGRSHSREKVGHLADQKTVRPFFFVSVIFMPFSWRHRLDIACIRCIHTSHVFQLLSTIYRLSYVLFFFYVFRVKICKHLLPNLCAKCLALIMFLFLTLTIFSGTTIMKLVIVKLMFKYAVGRWKEEIFWTWMMGNKIQERVTPGYI
jgi:hypothetical protein